MQYTSESEGGNRNTRCVPEPRAQQVTHLRVKGSKEVSEQMMADYTARKGEVLSGQESVKRTQNDEEDFALTIPRQPDLASLEWIPRIRK